MLEDKELGCKHGQKVYNTRYRWRDEQQPIFLFRASPVPHTGRSGWRFKHYYRRPRHINNLRLREEGNQEGFWTPKKGRGYIPDPWDDVPRERTKSWKKYRKVQYR